jgi:DHA2 family multidrug resistance protein
VVAPALGGYLTDAYGWRSVFLVSVPLGVLSLAVCYALVPGDRAGNAPRFDWFGFIALSIGLAGIQMILSRGQGLDWLESTEIVVLVGVVVVALYVFTVHIATAANTFLNLRLFLDRNFSTGILIMFAYSHMILAPLVLIPTMLESLRGLEAVTIGVLLLPRGLGQITGLLISGWLVHRIDPRALLLAGFLAHAWSTWVMAGYTLGIGVWEVVWPGVVQGLAMGMIFVPAITLTFATLDPALRTEGAAIFSLTRNFGTSIGVSLAVTLLARSVQVSHARLAEHAVPGNELLSLAEYADGWDLADVEGLAAIERAITEQATMIAYVNVYWSMTVFALAVIPLIFLVRGVPRSR